MRTKVEWRAASKENYSDFCKKHPSIHLSFDQWKSIVYGFNESFRDHILETGDKIKFPLGFGEFSVNKKKRKHISTYNGKQHINLSVDWIRTREKGKTIYDFNYHTEGYVFYWQWFKPVNILKYPDLWYFKACRASSRLLAHYLKVDGKYQHLYKQWIIK